MKTWIRYNQTAHIIEERAEIEEGDEYKENILESLIPVAEMDEAFRQGEWNESYYAYTRENGDNIFIQKEN